MAEHVCRLVGLAALGGLLVQVAGGDRATVALALLVALASIGGWITRTLPARPESLVHPLDTPELARVAVTLDGAVAKMRTRLDEVSSAASTVADASRQVAASAQALASEAAIALTEAAERAESREAV